VKAVGTSGRSAVGDTVAFAVPRSRCNFLGMRRAADDASVLRARPDRSGVLSTTQTATPLRLESQVILR
jgi:hypothetical protein